MTQRLRVALDGAPAELTDAEAKIGTILLDNPREAPLLTAAQLAARVGVHESTVIRFAQKLGYPGYLALRSDLAQDLLQYDTVSTRLRERGDQFSLDLIVKAQIESLARLPDHITQESINAAADAIVRATRVHVFGSGLLAPLAEFFERKLLLLGISGAMIRERGRELAERVASIEPTDAVVLFAFSEQYADLEPYVAALSDQGSSVLLITDESVARMKPAPLAVLSVPRPEVFGLFVPLVAVCYALDFTVAHLVPDRVRATRERVAQLTAWGARPLD
jgi:DNA-binding MurR/RpiR family transcriptional regulator